MYHYSDRANLHQKNKVTLMKTLILAALLALATTMTFAGSCDHSWQSAKDGSSCGDRAADRRPGGKY